jgi:hypothetical protein
LIAVDKQARPLRPALMLWDQSSAASGTHSRGARSRLRI